MFKLFSYFILTMNTGSDLIYNISIDDEIISYKLYNTIGDGACFLRTLSLALYGTENFHCILRRKLVQFVVNNYSFYGSFIFHHVTEEPLTAEEYSDYMTNPHTYTTYTEMMAAASYLSRRIVVIERQEVLYDYGHNDWKRIVCLITGPREDGHFGLLLPLGIKLPNPELFNGFPQTQPNPTVHCVSSPDLLSLPVINQPEQSQLSISTAETPTLSITKSKRKRRSTNLSRYTKNLKYQKKFRDMENAANRELRLVDDAIRHASRRESETPEERNKRLNDDSERHTSNRHASKRFKVILPTQSGATVQCVSLTDPSNFSLNNQPEQSHLSIRTTDRPTLSKHSITQSKRKKSKTNLSRNTNNSNRKNKFRDKESTANRELRLVDDAIRHSTKRKAEMPKKRNQRLNDDGERHASKRHASKKFSSQSSEEHNSSLLRRNEKRNMFLRKIWKPFNNAAFFYDPEIPYHDHSFLDIGEMKVICGHCDALKWKGESKGMCCSGGKIKISLLEEPPEPLISLLAGNSLQSQDFMKNIRLYNNCFQMTSFEQVVQ